MPAGSNGVLYTPWIYGERAPVDDRALRAGLYNLSLSNTREDIVRAFLEGVALNTRWLLKPVEKFLAGTAAHGQPGRRRRPVGGLVPDLRRRARRRGAPGARSRSRPTPAARPGSRAVGLGELTFADVARLVEVERVYEPQAANRSVYDERFAAFLEIHKRMRPFYRRLNRDGAAFQPEPAGGRT